MDADKDLLRRAAKAAGYDVRAANYESPDLLLIRLDPNCSWMPFNEWNPLNDDGDALRLAVKLDIHIGPNPGNGNAIAYSIAHICEEPYDADKFDATRRAIVRAAAALGGDDD